MSAFMLWFGLPMLLQLIEHELAGSGIWLNKKPPNFTFRALKSAATFWLLPVQQNEHKPESWLDQPMAESAYDTAVLHVTTCSHIC
jgi:hypothetical protein